MPAGAAGPFGIADGRDKTRVFIALHALPEAASGAFKVKFFSAGANSVGWFVAGLSPDAKNQPSRRAAILSAAKEPLGVSVETGKPAIIVRDAFAPDISTAGARIERPKKTIVSNSGEFELQIFDKYYRVIDIKTGEIAIERAGINPNFSPSSRFLGAFAEGAGFEIIDLYADAIVATSGALNRRENFEGTAHLAAWSYNDALVALSFWGWGGVYVQQSLVDGLGVGDGMPSCHACQGIGTELFANIDTGIIAWSGQQTGWASLLVRGVGSKEAQARTEAEIPNPNFESDLYTRQQALMQKLSSEALNALGARYFFDGKALLDQLPKDVDVTNYDGKAWHLGGRLQLSHACTQDAADNCSSLGIESDEGKAALKALAAHRIEHHGVKANQAPTIQVADARLISARAVLGRRDVEDDEEQTGGIWRRLQQLGVPLSEVSRADIPVETFDWQATTDNPAMVVDKVAAKIPSMREIMVDQKDSLDVPDFVDEQHEIKKIDPRKVTRLANWRIRGTEYWLIHENYQSNNSATANTQYLHLVSGNASAMTGIIDLSTRLAVDGILAKGTDQLNLGDHPWPSDFDIVTISAERYLLASGHWLHDNERWGWVYDLEENKTLFFNGNLPSATTTKALSLTDNGKVFVVANSNEQVYFYSIATGKNVLTANYVDDELVVYTADGYYMSTYEGSQFVFLKFPGQPGYLSFKQFAKVLNRPDIIKSIFDGIEPAAEPNLVPPPRLQLTAKPEGAAPGTFHLSMSATSTRDLATLRLFVDGQLWNERTVSGRALHIDERVVIPAQARWLTAVAVDAAGSESIPVAREMPRDSRASGRKLFVLAVGTDTYVNLPQNLQLRYAVADAKHFVSAASSQKSGYYKAVETTPLLDKRGLKAELPKTLRSIAQSATEDDSIMLFVSGHGYRANDGKLYLVLNESSLDDLEESSLSWDELAHGFEGTKARIIVFIDACHSGAVPNGGSNDEIADTLAAQQIRFTVVAAAKGRQESFEKQELGGGVFTNALVAALGNRAAVDSNKNGVIELSELYSKVKPAVLTEMQGLQTPWLARADMVGEVPLF